MPFLELFLIALGLSMDACAVAICVGSAGYADRKRNIARLSLSFGFFQFIMPVAGWYLGSRVAPLIADFDHWVAFALLAFVGIRMMRAGLSAGGQLSGNNPTQGRQLFLLSVATSIDALAIGLSFSMLRLKVLYPSIIIGLVTCLMSVGGMVFGKYLHAGFGRKMEIAGGALLLLIGVRIVILHLFP